MIESENAGSNIQRILRAYRAARIEVIGLVVGLCLTALQTSTAINEQQYDREDRSIRYVSQYYSRQENLLDTVIWLGETQYAGIKAYNDQGEMPEDDVEYFDQAREYIRDAFLREDEGQTVGSPFVDIVRVGKFFDNVVACVERNSCDSQIIREGLHSEMYSYFNAICAVYGEVRQYMNVTSFLNRTARFLEDNSSNTMLFVCPERLAALARNELLVGGG